VVVVVEERYRERKSIAYFINALAGEENTVSVYKVSAGMKFYLERVTIYFQNGSAFELIVAIYRGLEQVKPTNGVYRADGGFVQDTTKVEFGSGEDVKVYYKNTNTTTARKALVLLEGYEE